MVTAHEFDAASGVLTRTQTMTTLRPGDKGSTSECELSPDATVLYVANRVGDDSTIAAFGVDSADGSLSLLGHQLCGNHPRFFQVSDICMTTATPMHEMPSVCNIELSLSARTADLTSRV